MTIEEMHVTFRELAQQMGMQTVRAILPENIDICLRVAINDFVKDLIQSSVGIYPYSAKVIKHNANVAPINGLRTLYRKDVIDESQLSGEGTEIFPFSLSINNDSVMIYTGLKLSYDGNTLYDCRIVEVENLGQTLRDFCNRPTKDAPICTIKGDATMSFDIITGRNVQAKPKLIQYLYLAKPAEVYYDELDANNNVNCDLPDYTHLDIVKLAVNVYLNSIGANRSTNKNND